MHIYYAPVTLRRDWRRVVASCYYSNVAACRTRFDGDLVKNMSATLLRQRYADMLREYYDNIRVISTLLRLPYDKPSTCVRVKPTYHDNDTIVVRLKETTLRVKPTYRESGTTASRHSATTVRHYCDEWRHQCDMVRQVATRVQDTATIEEFSSSLYDIINNPI